MRPEKILADFDRALEQLAGALETPAETDLIKAGCIQYFEFCFEPAWKAIKAVAPELGLECDSPRACLKLAFLPIHARLPDFLRAMQELHARLRSMER